MMRHELAFLHTAAVHIDTFSRLAEQISPGIRVRHVVAPALLEEARSAGLTPALRQRVRRAMEDAASSGADVAVCTCSTIGSAAEGVVADFVAMRIDRPMADAAVRYGNRILVAAALESTLAPTRRLLADSARMAGREVMLSELLVAGAWSCFERGDRDAYAAKIAGAILETARDCDVVVLAQASMAPAVERCRSLPVPILSSPSIGVQAAVGAVNARRARRAN